MTTKESVLLYLERFRGAQFSGGELAKTLGISRNAVWKAVRQLKAEGHAIAATQAKGYRLLPQSDVITPQGIVCHLEDASLLQNIFVHSSLESTNKTAKQLAMQGAPQGTAVIANHQTQGRGRYGRSFFSAEGGGIYLSILLDPKRIAFASPTLITAWAAVVVSDAIEAVCKRSGQIKWVNDIYYNGRKVCGILTEAGTGLETGQLDWVVVGIGINFERNRLDFPPELREIAGGIFTGETPRIGTRNQLIAAILNRMVSRPTPTAEAMLAAYRKRLNMLEKVVTVVSAAGEYEAVAKEVDAQGRLLVQTPTGELHTLDSGEVRVRPVG